MSFSRKAKGIVWQQELPPHSIDSVIFFYRQKTAKNKGHYILTTTKYWNWPLEEAFFTVITPTGIKLKYWSFQADSVYMRGEKVVYAAKKSFLPESDMILEWKCE